MASNAQTPPVPSASLAYTDPMGAYNCIKSCHTHVLLINAPDAASACLLNNALTLLRKLVSKDSRTLSEAANILRLGALSEAILPPGYKAFFKRDCWRELIPGQHLAGVGTYRVELCIAEINTIDEAKRVGALFTKAQVIGVSRADTTLDVDAWQPSDTMSSEQLQDAIAALIAVSVERHDIERSLQAGSPHQSPSL